MEIGKKTERVGFRVKAVEGNFTADGERRTISGYAAVFNNKDRDRDVLLRGCFAKSIADRGPESDANGKILLLWQHEQDQPLGRITVLREDEKGLYFEAEIDRVEIGDRAIKQLESGTLNQFSIGFAYVRDGIRYDEETDTFFVSEVKLYEVSVVSIAANPETEFLGMKNAASREDAVKRLEEDITEACKGLPIDRQEKIQRLVARTMALSDAAPHEDARGGVKAAQAADTSVFDCFTKTK